jgi:hypothetical protein
VNSPTPSDPRPLWCLTARRQVLPTDKVGPRDVVIMTCREGDATWQPAPPKRADTT